MKSWKRFIWKIVKQFSPPIVKWVYLSKTQAYKDQQEIKEMCKVSYAQAVGSLIYARLALAKIYAT